MMMGWFLLVTFQLLPFHLLHSYPSVSLRLRNFLTPISGQISPKSKEFYHFSVTLRLRACQLALESLLSCLVPKKEKEEPRRKRDEKAEREKPKTTRGRVEGVPRIRKGRLFTWHLCHMSLCHQICSKYRNYLFSLHLREMVECC